MKIFKVNSFSFNGDKNIIQNGERIFHFKSYEPNSQYFTFQREDSTLKDYTIPLCAFISSKDEQKKFLDWFKEKYPEWLI